MQLQGVRKLWRSLWGFRVFRAGLGLGFQARGFSDPLHRDCLSGEEAEVGKAEDVLPQVLRGPGPQFDVLDHCPYSFVQT